MEETIAKEISSILESDHLSSEEKYLILDSYNWPKDDKITTSSPIQSKKKVAQHIEAKIKKDDDDKLTDDAKLEKNDESMSRPSSQQAKEVIDPLTDKELSSILASELSSEEKSSLLIAYLTEDQIKSCNTLLRVELEAKVQPATETKPKEDKNNLPSHGVSKETNAQSLSQEANAKVPLDLKLTTPNEKSSSSACNRNEKEDIVTSSEVKTFANSSRVKLKEKNQHMGTEANLEHDPITRHEDGSAKLIHKASLLHAQQDPVEHRHLLQELKLEQAIVIAQEIKEPQDNPVGENVEKIYKEEAVCKKCCKYMFDEPIVLKAKCKCKLALIHEKCATEWSDEKGSKCPVCGEEIENVKVELKMDASTSSPQHSTADQLEEPTSAFDKWFCSCF